MKTYFTEDDGVFNSPGACSRYEVAVGDGGGV
jgi:hypothetical protein